MVTENDNLSVLGYSIGLESDRRILDLIGNTAGFILLEGGYGINQLAMDSIMLSSRILEKSLVDDGMYSFHSSAISNGKEVVILGGGSSSGKTTTSVNSCLCFPNDISIYSGDRTILKGCKALAGTKKFHMRVGSIAYEMPELQNYIIPKETETPWDKIELVEPEKIGIHTDSGERDVKCFVYLRRGAHKKKIERIRDDRALLRLHDSVCHFSDSYPNMILGQRQPINIHISGQKMKERIDYISSLFKEIPVLTVSGDLQEMTKSVTELLMNGDEYEKYIKK